MANIYIRRNTTRTSSVGNNVNNSDRRTENGNVNVGSIGLETTSESDSDVNDATGDDNSVDEPVNTTRFNPNDYEFIDPISATNNGDNTGEGRKRRRRSDSGIKRGSRGKRNSGSETETTKDIAALLLTVHFGMAKLLHAEKLKLSEEESQQLAKAITRVTSLYEVPLMSEKQRAWIGLAFTAGCIYIPRMKKEKESTAKQPDNVVRMGYQPPKQPISVQEAYQEAMQNNKPVQ